MLKKSFLYLAIVSNLIFSGCFISGKVVDENGEGVAGVTVTLSGDLSWATTTDSDGRYRFGELLAFLDIIPAGNYTVTPSKCGHSFTPATADVTIVSQSLGDLEDICGPRIHLDFVASDDEPTVTAATIERPQDKLDTLPFVPVGEYQSSAADFDYVEEEWFASGTDDACQPYTTLVYVRRPRNPAHFSGVLIAEPLHAGHGAAPILIYSSPYIMRSGHGYACITSQKVSLDTAVKPVDPEHYAALHIETESPQASNAILAQVGAALWGPAGPFDGYQLDFLLLAGHSQTGFVVTNFINEAHGSYRLADGLPVFDGFLPTGWPWGAFGPCDVPIIQVISDGDTSWFGGRHYRRADSDDPKDRYRLYELAGVPHMGTRYPPMNDPQRWLSQGAITEADVAPAAGADVGMNSLPHHELFNMALDHLVQWVANDVTPPRADRIELAPDGQYFAKDEHGNSRGGVRCVQMDVPHSTYYSTPLKPDGTPRFSTVGIEDPFGKAKMTELYGNRANYVERFNLRLDELISQGWFLADDADNMRAEAELQSW